MIFCDLGRDDNEDDIRARRRLEDYNRIIRRLKTKWMKTSPHSDSANITGSDDSVQEKLETARLPSILMFDHPRRGMRKRDLGKLAFHEYDTAYKTEIRAARKLLRETCRRQGPKMMQGNVPLTGQSFASQLKTLTRALNEQEHVGDALIKFQARSVAASALASFTSWVI